ncbi:MAG: dihydropyrimidinase [Verrucomicrobiae bacterium]|nr:dihydropyrimidinase [Verrucomicrobiae bacterium]
MSLLIKNGQIITASDNYIADIYCENEQITKIEKNLEVSPGAEVIDAKGKYVFPGFIDPHTHIYLPFMGTYAKDTYETASKAALVGGTTTIFDMCCPSRQMEAIEGFETWNSKSEGKSACDYTYHMGVTKFDDKTESQLKEIVSRGISSFKIFLAYKGAFGIDDAELYQTLKLAKKLGVVTTAHCENETLVAERQKELIAAGKTESGYHHESRPPLVEAEGVHHLMTFAEMHDAHIYIVHLSCDEALREALWARYRGVNVWIETLIQYLVLDKTDAEKPNFEGSKYVMSPPLRDKRNQSILWQALRSGFVNTVATDHAPFDFKDQKPMGKNDFTKIPNGIPALEDRVNLLYSYGVKQGKLDLNRFVDCASTQAAKIFGLYPRKGTIQIGSDADLVIYDPNYRGKISTKTQLMNVDYSAFEGWELTGKPSVVTVRGQVAVRDGKFVGKIGHGKFLKREPNHF